LSQTEIVAEADAFVNDGARADTNFGGEQYLLIKRSAPGFNYIGYFRFDLSGLSGTITSAKLKLTRYWWGQNGSHTALFVSNDSWSETTITWNTMPAASETLATWPIDTLVPTIEVDLTPIVLRESAGDKKLTIQVKDATGNLYAQYRSREYATVASRPKLVCVLSSAGDATRPAITGISSPKADGTTSWNLSTAQTLTWSATDNVGVARFILRLSKDNGATWTGIADTSVAPTSLWSGSYTWTTPATGPSTQCKIRVIAYDAAGNLDSARY